MAPEPHRHSVHIAAEPEQVFPYFTRPEAIVRWMGDHAVLDPRPDGEFTLDINGVPVRGRYLELDPPRRLVISWGHAGSETLPPGASTVEITLTQMKAARRSASPTAVCPISKRASTRSAGRTSSNGWSLLAPAVIPDPIRGLRPIDLSGQFPRGWCLCSWKAKSDRLEDRG